MQLYSVRLCKEKGPDYRGFVQVQARVAFETHLYTKEQCCGVLGILVRIRICGSLALTSGSGSGSCF